MDHQDPILQRLIDQVRAASASGTPLDIQGGNTKRFYGDATAPGLQRLDVTPLRGVSSYEPTELVVTARAGTPLAELEALLAERGQCLPFEPPSFGPASTVGGMVAAGLAGPSRAAVGSVRDYVLGTTLLSGRAEVLSFGGQVMKNVAGYDVSRVLAGSLGTLGVMLEVSLKVLPLAPATTTLRFDVSQAEAIDQLNTWGGQPLPLNASAWWNGTLVVRLRGAIAAVQAATRTMGGEVLADELATPFWDGLRHHTDVFFASAHEAIGVPGSTHALWRLSVPDTAAPLSSLPGDTLVEWGGAQRWLSSDAPAAQVRAAAAAVGGHATRFLGPRPADGVFTPLSTPLARIHRDLKAAFDPAGIFNPGRLYAGL